MGSKNVMQPFDTVTNPPEYFMRIIYCSGKQGYNYLNISILIGLASQLWHTRVQLLYHTDWSGKISVVKFKYSEMMVCQMNKSNIPDKMLCYKAEELTLTMYADWLFFFSLWLIELK